MLTSPAVAGDKGGMAVRFSTATTKKSSIEVMVAPYGTTAAFLGVQLIYYDGANWHPAYVVYDFANEKWQYRDSAATLQDIPGATKKLPYHATRTYWTRIRLVVDHDTGKYVSLQVGEDVYDLSEYDIQEAVNTDEENLAAGFYIEASTTTAVTAHIAECLVLQEP